MRDIKDIDEETKEKLFISDEKVKEIKDFIYKTLLSKTDWRQGYRHFDIYNKINFQRGLLEKLQEIRITPQCYTVEFAIDILHVLGYSHKRIIYILWQFGFEFETRFVVNKHLVRHKTRLRQEREKFMSMLKEIKKNVFQEIGKEVREAEEKSLRLYIEKLKEIQDKLAETSPIDEPSLFRRLSSQIEMIQKILNDAHGVNQARIVAVDISGKVALAEELSRIKKEDGLPVGDTLPQIGGPSAPLLEV